MGWNNYIELWIMSLGRCKLSRLVLFEKLPDKYERPTTVGLGPDTSRHQPIAPNEDNERASDTLCDAQVTLLPQRKGSM